VDESRDRPLKESVDAIVSAGATWQGGFSFEDDVSIVALEIENA
jgi:hypothetical protein